MLKVKVEKNFGGFQLHMDFTEESRRIGILGASGSGKSMTLKSIAGILQPDQGEIVLNDHVLFDSAKKVNLRPQERRVGYLFQNYALFPSTAARRKRRPGLRKCFRSSRSVSWAGGFRDSFPAGSSREWHWRGSWPISRM